MEDEDSKTRRNLLAVCTIILLVWWLQAPIDKMTEKLLSMPSVAAGFEWRVWFAATVSVVYFSLRYRFSSLHTEALGEFTKEWHEERNHVTKTLLKIELFLYRKTGLKPRLFTKDFHDRITNRTVVENAESNLTGLELAEIYFGNWDDIGQPINLLPNELHGHIKLFIASEDKAGSYQDVLENIEFSLGRIQRGVVAAVTLSRIFLYSKTSTSLMVPWLFATAALSISLWQQWKTW